MKDFKTIKLSFPYEVDITFNYSAPYMTGINNWCEEQFGKEYDRWMWEVSPVSQARRYHFTNEKDLSWFILRWSQ